MFFEHQPNKQQKQYLSFLKTMGSLSNLFSESSVPYLYYRVAEKVFCRAFEADDLSRSDLSADAKKNGIGVGLKTFLIGNSKTFQKVAEFNSDRKAYETLTLQRKVRKIAEFRNERVLFTEKTFGLSELIYHCIVRKKGKFVVFEEPVHKIDIQKISHIKENKGSIFFDDGINDYSFLTSKSTLTKRFEIKKCVAELEIKIVKDPLLEIEKMFKKGAVQLVGKADIVDTIYLPLYGKKHIVYEKSGLNQWHAGGRKRDLNEVYIPIPAEVNHKKPTFFPDRDTSFILVLPNGKEMKSKVCQENNKALMSYSNRELGQWILRDVLNLKEGELLKYSKLETIGVDSVRIDKKIDGKYDINFTNIGSYEEFIESENVAE